MAESGAWEPDEATVELVQKYGHLLNNTGGNDPIWLLRQFNTVDNLIRSNIVVYTMAVSVHSQLGILARLRKEGLLA